MAPVAPDFDLQRDFLARPGLAPIPPTLVRHVARLVGACRELGVPVLHVHTDGAGPSPLPPLEGEPVFRKRFYRADADLAGFDTVIVAGLYLHACVREA